MAMTRPISVCMLAVNEADRIAAALESARACPWCDELLVFDSGSTDDTVSVAERIADRVEHHDWVDFSTNRRKLVEAARNDWVMVLDADEAISPGLAAEIGRLDDGDLDRHPVFTMPRHNYLFGRHVRAWDPDRVDRLFDRTRVTWPSRSVHDYRKPTEGAIGHLSNPILHNRDWDCWLDYFDGDRYQKRTDALAQEMADAGRSVGFFGLALRPLAAFLKFYILRRGFLDGAFGLLIAQKAAFSAQLKYARLWHLRRKGGDGPRDGADR